MSQNSNNKVTVVQYNTCKKCRGEQIKALYLVTEDGKKGDILEKEIMFFADNKSMTQIFKQSVDESWTWLEANCATCGTYWPNQLLKETNKYCGHVPLGMPEG